MASREKPTVRKTLTVATSSRNACKLETPAEAGVAANDEAALGGPAVPRVIFN
jgi:hypothetical protein